MTVYRPKGKNTGVAVVVFLGGGYNCLVMDLEGMEICDWLTSMADVKEHHGGAVETPRADSETGGVWDDRDDAVGARAWPPTHQPRDPAPVLVQMHSN
jgi:hypothetical protein